MTLFVMLEILNVVVLVGYMAWLARQVHRNTVQIKAILRG